MFTLKVVLAFTILSAKVLSPSFLLKGTYTGTRRKGLAEVGKMSMISKQAFKCTFPYFLSLERPIPITFNNAFFCQI